jgi:hypothetical protein
MTYLEITHSYSSHETWLVPSPIERLDCLSRNIPNDRLEANRHAICKLGAFHHELPVGFRCSAGCRAACSPFLHDRAPFLLQILTATPANRTFLGVAFRAGFDTTCTVLTTACQVKILQNANLSNTQDNAHGTVMTLWYMTITKRICHEITPNIIKDMPHSPIQIRQFAMCHKIDEKQGENLCLPHVL